MVALQRVSTTSPCTYLVNLLESMTLVVALQRVSTTSPCTYLVNLLESMTLVVALRAYAPTSPCTYLVNLLESMTLVVALPRVFLPPTSPRNWNSNELCYTTIMIVGVSQITLHLPNCHSLKDKRQVIKSVLARIRNQFEVAIAEVDEQDRWQIAKIGVSCVSNNSQHVDEVLSHVRRFIEETRPDIFVTNTETEIINW